MNTTTNNNYFTCQRGFWSEQEDKNLEDAVNKNGARNWSHISTFVKNRNGKQCRERYLNHLDPTIKKNNFSAEEDKIIIKSQRKYGNSWSKISTMLEGRTPNSIKNHWYGSLNKTSNQSEKKRKRESWEKTMVKRFKLEEVKQQLPNSCKKSIETQMVELQPKIEPKMEEKENYIKFVNEFEVETEKTLDELIDMSSDNFGSYFDFIIDDSNMNLLDLV